MSTHSKRASGLDRESVRVWAPTPQPASSTRLPRRIDDVAVEQFGEGAGLVGQPAGFFHGIAMDTLKILRDPLNEMIIDY